MTRLKEFIDAAWDRLYHKSAEENIEWFLNKVRGKIEAPSEGIFKQLIKERVAAEQFLATRLKSLSDEVILLGQDDCIKLAAGALARAGKKHRVVSASNAHGNLQIPDGCPKESDTIICVWPTVAHEWDTVASLKRCCPNHVLTLQELLLPLYVLWTSTKYFPYRFQEFSEVMSYYVCEKWMGPMEELNVLFPIAGKTVIEFGPYDGYQTAALLKLKAKFVTCVEVRAENVLKTATAKHIFNWENVRVLADDFHNVDSQSCGTYDLAFAHGVYYHSFCPFVFLENLCSLSRNVFVGGYVATETDPQGDFLQLEYLGETYRAKESREGTGIDQGINLKGYFFHREDLEKFFTKRGYTITEMSGHEDHRPTGRYFRFLARK